MSKVNAVPFHEKSYWETRFDKEKHFEWLATWKNIKSEAEPYLDKSNAILHLGKQKVAVSSTMRFTTLIF